MKKPLIIVSIVLCIVSPFIGVKAAEKPAQLLVLSDIEERIAGKMALYRIEHLLAKHGDALTRVPDITAIGRKLAHYSDRVHLRYSFYVIQGDIEPQAFSLPGGYVLISQSMLDAACRTDDDIAFILGHEIAHSALRHYADYRLRDHQQVAYVKQLIHQYSFLQDDKQFKHSEELQEILSPYVARIRQIKEVEADQFGALYALRAGYHYSAGIHVLERLRELFGEEFQLERDDLGPLDAAQVPEPASHPTLSERIEQLQLFRLKAIEVSKLFPSGREALDRGNYQEASLIFDSILSLFPQSRTARIGMGVTYHLQYWESSSADDFLLAYPGALEFENLQLLRGTPDFQSLQEAIEEYRYVLSLEPGNKYAVNNLGVALAEFKQFDEAEQILREALRLDGAQDFILFNLALVLRQKYQKTQQIAFKNEMVALLTQYLKLAPSDEIAREYLKECTPQESP